MNSSTGRNFRFSNFFVWAFFFWKCCHKEALLRLQNFRTINPEVFEELVSQARTFCHSSDFFSVEQFFLEIIFFQLVCSLNLCKISVKSNYYIFRSYNLKIGVQHDGVMRTVCSGLLKTNISGYIISSDFALRNVEYYLGIFLQK